MLPTLSHCVVLLAGVILQSTASVSAALQEPVNVGGSVDQYDFSYIKKWAAIGDLQFASLQDKEAANGIQHVCDRDDSGYLEVLDQRLAESSPDVGFTIRACAGDNASEVIQQAEVLDAGQQMITISAGGSNIGLGNVYKKCYAPTSECEAAGQTTQFVIESDEMRSEVEMLIDLAKAKLSVDGIMLASLST